MTLIAEVYSPEVVVNTSSTPIAYTGHEGVKTWVETTRRAYPDMKMTFDEIVAEGDKIATVWTLTGTNTGTLKMPAGELPPTGNKVQIKGLAIDYVQNGKLVKEIVVFDVLAMMMQMGFTLNPPQPGE